MSSRHLILFGSKYYLRRSNTYIFDADTYSASVSLSRLNMTLSESLLSSNIIVWLILYIYECSDLHFTKTPVLIKMLDWSYGWDQCQCWRGDGVTTTGSLVSTPAPVSPSLLLSPGRLHQTRQHGGHVWPWCITVGDGSEHLLLGLTLKAQFG